LLESDPLFKEILNLLSVTFSAIMNLIYTYICIMMNFK